MANRNAKTPEHMARMRAASMAARCKPLEERFWAKVDKRGPNDCWPWTASLLNGHGELWVGYDASPQKELAHRISWRLHGLGDIPAGLWVDHTCRNRACQNPVHLRLVTKRVNALENNSSPFALNAAKTTCPRGHAKVAANLTKPNKLGYRQCRICYEMRLRGEIPKGGPKPVGWITKIRALPIGGTLEWPRHKDVSGVRAGCKERGIAIRVRKLNESTSLIERVSTPQPGIEIA